MAKIQLKDNGKYEFWVDLGRDPVTGKRRQVHRSGFDRKKDAEAEIRRLQNEADRGIVVNKRQASITFAELAEIWLEHYRATSGSKASTCKAKKDNIASLNKLIGAVKIKDMSKQRYEQLLITLDAKYKKNTVDALHITASMIFEYAVEHNLLSINPTKAAKKPKKAKTLEEVEEDIEEKYLSKSDLNHLLNVIKASGDLQYYALFSLLAYSGMRIGEALGLEASKIDFEASKIKIRQTCCNDKSRATEYYLQTPKTDSSIRDIDMDANTMAILRLWLSEQKKNKMRYRDVWHNEHDFVFTSATCPGYPMPYSTANRMLRKYFEIAGLNTSFTLHTLRHTHASLLAESGATLEQIQERLGHGNDEITRRIYLHVTKDSKIMMMEKFASYVKA